MHDVGHLPFGHTLEDELNHLRSHDGPERLERVARIAYPNHEVDQWIIAAKERPSDGWTLKALIDRLYEPHARAVGITDVDAFTVLSHIVCKPPNAHEKKKTWDEKAKDLSSHLWLGVCRDIVGNTICADFLDYIHRDWYHLGKPLYYDKRLYQYMEVRRPAATDGGNGAPRFVINVGASEKIRHDALTDILELLNARYKLAETVLFHRTKMALTGLLDRCVLEIADLYQQAGLPADKFMDNAEALLLEASDDGLPMILRQLAEGGNKEGKRHVEEAIQEQRSAIRHRIEGTPQAELELEHGASGEVAPQDVGIGEIEAQQDLALRLIDRLRDREVYTLVYKLRMSDFTGPHNPTNPRLLKLLRMYKEPGKRLEFLRLMEARCEFPPGTLIMNCPSDAAMNAKVAKVSLFIEGDVNAFDDYEHDQGEASLTRGALWAQINRFYELWAASIHVDRREWDRLSADQQKHLKSLVREFFFQMDAGADRNIVRMQMEPSVQLFAKKASQKGTVDPRKARLRGSVFPSGLPFELG